jgi:hypothetical protein
MNKNLKGAVLLVIVSFVLMTMVFLIAVVMIRGQDISRFLSGGSAGCTADAAMKKAAEFIKSTATFKYDGIGDSLKLVKIEAGKEDGSWTVDYSFQTRHPGHGNRKGQVLTQVITNHTAELSVKSCKVVAATCDNEWNLATDKPLP